MERVAIQGLQSTEYEHPLDRVTMEALKKIPLFPKLLELVTIPKSSIARLELLGSNLRVNERQFKSLYKIMREACEVLDMEEPILYVSSQPELNAYTSCPDKPIICIYGYLLDIMDDDELMFVLGHELSHIKSQHIIYQTLGVVLANNMLSAIMSTIPGLSTFSTAAINALNYAYYEWFRAAELSCDRGGFLANQNFKASCTALMKLAGSSKRFVDELNLDEFIEQSREFKEVDSSALGVVQKIILSYGRSHPWSVSRVGELIKFSDSGRFTNVLQRTAEPEELEGFAVSTASVQEAATQTYDKAKTAAKGAFSGLTKGLLKFTEEPDDGGSDDSGKE